MDTQAGVGGIRGAPKVKDRRQNIHSPDQQQGDQDAARARAQVPVARAGRESGVWSDSKEQSGASSTRRRRSQDEGEGQNLREVRRRLMQQQRRTGLTGAHSPLLLSKGDSDGERGRGGGASARQQTNWSR